MGGTGSEPGFEEVEGWRDGFWQRLPIDVLDSETGAAVLAVNRDEYPALAALLRHADDLDDYLTSLGVTDDEGEATLRREEQSGMDA